MNELPRVRCREELACLFSKLGLTSGVEVGVFMGDFAAAVLARWKGRLWLVDPWVNIPGRNDSSNLSDDEFERVFKQVEQRFAGQAEIVRMTSPSAASKFADNELGWVYIDGDHRQAAVEADLAAWWPKVVSGGVFAGHDYATAVGLESNYGVVPAVDGFFSKMGLNVGLTEDGFWKSWYLIKA
jgi:hypothetical protein